MKRFLRLACFDWRVGLLIDKVRIQLAVALLFVVAWSACTSCASYWSDGTVFLDATKATFLTAIQGAKEAPVSINVPLIIPADWFAVQVAIGITAGWYPACSLVRCGAPTVLFSGSRLRWWLSKCTWGIGVAISAYLVLALFSSFVAFFSCCSGRCAEAGWCQGEGVPGALLDSIPVELVLVSVALSVSLTLCQLALSMKFGPTVSFATLLIYLALSTFLDSNYLVGDLSMLLRSRGMLMDGISFTVLIAVCGGIALVAVLLGSVYACRMDALASQDAKE